MNILLVNDDGYQAEGIRTLEAVLAGKGHNIFVTAPSVEQSAKSHSMTIWGSCYATRYQENHYHISGSPADCIIYSLKSGLIPVKPDLVISGINHGFNLSSDIIYSGTCAAARQACFYGHRAIAISTHKSKANEYDFKSAAEFLAENLESFYPMLDSSAFLNINIPYGFDGTYELSSIGEIDYQDKFSLEEEEDGRYRITNVDCIISYHEKVKSRYPKDFDVCRSGKASVSFVKILPDISESHMGAFDEAR